MLQSLKNHFTAAVMMVIALSCSQDALGPRNGDLSISALDMTQASGQLASGTSFHLQGSSTTLPGSSPNGRGMGGPNHGPGHHDRRNGLLDGLSMLAPNDELLAIVEAESAGDIRGMRISKYGGATITNYDAKGAVLSFPLPEGPEGPQGCSFTGKEFPGMDSLLSRIVKTEIDFGTGVTFTKDTVTIIRAGKIVINRSSAGNEKKEVTTFEGYSVNGIRIEGTKTRVTVIGERLALQGGNSRLVTTSTVDVPDGKFIFADGSGATWTASRKRTTDIRFQAGDGRPFDGSITTEVNTVVTGADGTVIYSHASVKPMVENVACRGRRHGPVSGEVKTIYRGNAVNIDFGNGSCEGRTVTINYNGVITTRTID